MRPVSPGFAMGPNLLGKSIGLPCRSKRQIIQYFVEGTINKRGARLLTGGKQFILYLHKRLLLITRNIRIYVFSLYLQYMVYIPYVLNCIRFTRRHSKKII